MTFIYKKKGGYSSRKNMEEVGACLVSIFKNYIGKQFLRTIFNNSF